MQGHNPQYMWPHTALGNSDTVSSPDLSFSGDSSHPWHGAPLGSCLGLSLDSRSVPPGVLSCFSTRGSLMWNTRHTHPCHAPSLHSPGATSTSSASGPGFKGVMLSKPQGGYTTIRSFLCSKAIIYIKWVWFYHHFGVYSPVLYTLKNRVIARCCLSFSDVPSGLAITLIPKSLEVTIDKLTDYFFKFKNVQPKPLQTEGYNSRGGCRCSGDYSALHHQNLEEPA